MSRVSSLNFQQASKNLNLNSLKNHKKVEDSLNLYFITVLEGIPGVPGMSNMRKVNIFVPKKKKGYG